VENFRLTLSCIYQTIQDALDNHIKEVIAYLFIFICSMSIVALIVYILSVVFGGPENSQYRGPIINAQWIILFVTLGAWVAYLTTLQVVADHGHSNWIILFGGLFGVGAMMVFIPAALFYGLCKLAGLPLPHSRGWGECVSELRHTPNRR
jgi:hypothetical protein